MVEIATSILSVEKGKEAATFLELEAAKTDYFHIDVMDGHFVPNISIGIPTVESIRGATDLILDVHLMISNPEKYIEKFARAGADIINFHLEATDSPLEIIEQIRKTGKKCGITVNPDTPVEKLFGLADKVDMILIMSVYPGFGGQEFIKSSLDKVKALSEHIRKNNLNVDIEIDGGVKIDNLRDVLDAGVNIVVVGSAIFEAEDMAAEAERFSEIFKEFEHR